MNTYPASPNLPYPAGVLSNEGALLEAILKWDRARAGRGGVTRTGRCGARGCASQAQTRGALGNRPCPLWGAAFNGWTGLEREGESPRDHGESLSSSRKNGPGVEEVAAGGAPNRRCRVRCFPKGNMPRPVTSAPFGAPLPLTKGRQTKSSPRAAA